jgi:hypothetical protein
MNPARLPFAIRALNAGLGALARMGPRLPRLNPEDLLRSARRQTGLENYGSDYFREPLRRLCESLEQDARLSAFGRIIARQDILRLLRNRLMLEETFRQHPQIADERIVAPVFILGMPRSGTTSMHELMALDPQFRVPLSWETAPPIPPPQSASYDTDPRIAKVDRELAQVDKLLPDFRYMHPMGARLPQECVALFAHDFVSMIFDVQFRLTQYQTWLIEQDMTEVFRNHRRWLQLLQWKKPGDTWVLKSPQYLWNIDDMLREYPDARIVQTHRDPVKVAMSIGSLTATLRSLGSEAVDLREVTRQYADLLDYGTRKTMSARAAGRMEASRATDMQFAEFRQDPVAAMHKVYAQLGFTLGPQTAAAMQRFLDEGTATERHGKHHYDIAASGIDLAAERLRFAGYQRAYAIPDEIFGS